MSRPDRKLRVLLATVNYAPETTGIGAYTTSLAESLAERGHRVDVLTAAPHYPEWQVRSQDQWLGRERRDSVNVRRLRSYVPAVPTLLKRTAFEVLYGIRFAARPLPACDVAVLVSPALFASAILRARLALTRRGLPCVVWLQDRYVSGTRELVRGPLRHASGLVRAAERQLAASADRVVVIHDRWADNVQADFDLADGQVSVVRNWTHIEMPADLDRAATRARLGWGADGEEIVALHAGNMGAKQDLENVVAAARLAEQEGLPVRFVLLGDGNRREAVRAAGAECGRLQFLASLPGDEYALALGAADVLLVNEAPRLRETAVPSKLTSYFAADRPVVAATEADSVTAAEVLASGAGIVVPPAEPARLLAGVRDAAARAQEFAGRGPAFAADVLGRDTCVDRFESILSAVSDTAHRTHQTKEH